MKTTVSLAAVAAINGVMLSGLKWLGLLSHDAVVVGFATGLGVALALMLGNSRDRNKAA